MNKGKDQHDRIYLGDPELIFPLRGLMKARVKNWCMFKRPNFERL